MMLAPGPQGLELRFDENAQPKSSHTISDQQSNPSIEIHTEEINQMEYDYAVNEDDILAASQHEFNQRLSELIVIIKESFVSTLTNNF